MRHSYLYFIILASSIVQATPLAGRFTFLNSASMPKDVWVFGSNISQNSVTSGKIYNDQGKLVSNQNYFSRDITFKGLIEEIEDSFEKDLAAAAFKAYGKDENELAGSVINDVDVKASANTFVFGRGLSDRADFLVIFPLVTINTKFNSRFELSPALKGLVSELRAEGQFSRAEEILTKESNALHEKLKDAGYETRYPSEITTLANIYLNYRYQAVRKTKLFMVLDSFFVIPAGETFDDNEFLDLRINEEQYSFKQAVTLGYSPNKSFETLMGAYYHKRFPFYKEKRIPINANGMISSDLDNNVRVQYGDSYGATLQLNYLPSSNLKLYVGQTLEYRNSDSYQGNDYASYRYDLLEDQTEQRLGEAFVGVQFNTISLFLKKKFLLPLDLNLQYNRTNLGKNTLFSETIALNLLGFYK